MIIRGIGPALRDLWGVGGVLLDPKLEVFRQGGPKLAENDNWETPIGTASGTGAQLASIFGQAGAFALAQGSKDAALLTNLLPGNYTLQVSGVNNATGAATSARVRARFHGITPARAKCSVAPLTTRTLQLRLTIGSRR